MADPVLNGKYIKELDQLTSIALDAWIAFQPDEISDQGYRISLTNFIEALPFIPAVAGNYSKIADLLDAQVGQTNDIFYRVIDPSDDPDYNDLKDSEIKAVYYHLVGSKTASLSDYNSIAIPKLESDKNAKLGNSLDALTFDIKFRSAEWSSNQATLQAIANALKVSSPQDLLLDAIALKVNVDNNPANISRVLLGLDGQLIFEPIDSTKIQSDSDATDVTLNDSYQLLLTITGDQSFSNGIANIGLTAKSFTTASITAFQASGNNRVTATSALHGLSEGDYIEIVNTTNYDGIYEVKAVPNVNDFDFTSAFVATETGDFEESANREIAVDLRVNSISVKEFTRQIEGKGRLNFSEQITSIVSTEDIDVYVKSNTAGEAIEILGTEDASELKVINPEVSLTDGEGTTANGTAVDLGGTVTNSKIITLEDAVNFRIFSNKAGDDIGVFGLKDAELSFFAGPFAGNRSYFFINPVEGRFGAIVNSNFQEFAAVYNDSLYARSLVAWNGLKYDISGSYLLPDMNDDYVIPYKKWIVDNVGRYKVAVEKTISAGTLDIGADRYIIINAETGTADNLDTITGTNLTEGEEILLLPKTGDTITLQNNLAPAINQIQTFESLDLVMRNEYPLKFVYQNTPSDGLKWLAINKPDIYSFPKYGTILNRIIDSGGRLDFLKNQRQIGVQAFSGGVDDLETINTSALQEGEMVALFAVDTITVKHNAAASGILTLSGVDLTMKSGFPLILMKLASGYHVQVNNYDASGGGGDMVLADPQEVTGAKTFLDTKLLLRNVANTFNGSFLNTNTADRIYTLQNAAGTLAFLTDVAALISDTETVTDKTLSSSKIDELFDEVRVLLDTSHADLTTITLTAAITHIDSDVVGRDILSVLNLSQGQTAVVIHTTTGAGTVKYFGGPILTKIGGTKTVAVLTNISEDGTPNIVVKNWLSEGIASIIEDTTPQLGGNLDLNGKDLDSVTAVEIGYVSGVTSAIQTQFTAAVQKALFDANTILAANADDTPAAVTIAEQTILGRITAGNIKGLTATEIRTLINVENGADVTDTANVTIAGALMDSEVDDDIKTLVLPANTTISTFGASLIDDATASNARTTLDVDQAGVNLHKTNTGDQTVASNVKFNKQAGVLGNVETFSATISFDLNDGNVQKMVITANITSLAVTNKVNSGSYRIFLTENGTGGYTIPTPGASFGTKTDNAADFVTAANAVNIIDITVDPDGNTFYSVETVTP